MSRTERIELIKGIESQRQSRVITFICSDRPGAGAQIGDDGVRPMYDLVRTIGKVERLDLYLYSRGGAVEVPWRVITMLREYCNELCVLIPYRAHSAATLIALGCDKIVMGPKAELGPIDPAINRVTQDTGTTVTEEIRVEDVMSYIGFIKDKAGLGDQAAIAKSVGIIAEKLTPWVLGSIYRTHSHIRMVARKLLGGHRTRIEDQRANLIIESLAEKTYLHGHGIGRGEAEELGLPVERPAQDIELAMWQLFESYESTLEMRHPVDPDTILGPNRDDFEGPLTIAMQESTPATWAFRGTLKLRRIRQPSPQIGINLNLGVSLPADLPPDRIPQEIMNQLMQQVQNDVPRMVSEQARQQSPIVKLEGRIQNGYWQDITGEDF